MLNPIPESLSFSRALGGSWLNRPLLWIIGFAPNVALAVILESSLLEHSFSAVLGSSVLFGGLLTSAVLQFAIAACVLSLIARWARRRGPMVSPRVVFVLLGLTATAQALVGGLFAEFVVGGYADFGWRLVFWLAVQWLWSPLVIYTLAQYEHRRYLFAERAVHIDSWNKTADDGIAALRNQHVALLALIHATVSPGIDEIRDRLNEHLREPTAPSRRSEFLNTAQQLIVLSTSMQALLATPHVTTTLVVGVPEHPRTFAPITEAMSYKIRRPYASSSVLTILLLSVLAPGLFRIGGFAAIVELTIAVVVSGLLFASGLQLINRFSTAGTRSAMVQSAIVHLTAAVAAPLIVSAMTWEPLGERGWLLMMLLPPGFIFAAITISGAFGLGDANRILVDELTNIRRRFARFHMFLVEEDERTNCEIQALTHGPIRGRIAACIMALKFHAEELTVADSVRGETILRAVATHLDATARDLDRMNTPTLLTSRVQTMGIVLGE